MKGYVICSPDPIFDGYNVMIFYEKCEAIKKMDEYKERSKWPHNVHIRKAWVYTQQGRKVWEPRS